MKKQNKPTFKFDLGIFLLMTGALANITIWIGAFVATESQGFVGEWVRVTLLPVLGGVSGLAMGLTVTVGLVYVIARLGNMKPTFEHKVRGKDEYRSAINFRFYGAWAAIVLLLIISPALLAPYVFMTISGSDSLFATLGEYWSRIWSVGRILAADLAMAAVAMVHGVHLPATALAGSATGAAVTSTKSDAGTTRTPKKKGGSASAMRKCDVPGCGVSYAWPNGKGGHMKKFHPDLVIQKGIPAQMSLPIKPEKKQP